MRCDCVQARRQKIHQWWPDVPLAREHLASEHPGSDESFVSESVQSTAAEVTEEERYIVYNGKARAATVTIVLLGERLDGFL